MPEGSTLRATDAAAKKVEALLAGDDDAATFTTYIGQGPPRFWLGLNPALPNEAYAEIVVVAKDMQARERLKAKVDAAVAKGAVPEGRVRTDRFAFGPPVGFPIQFRVIGPDPQTVRAIAYQVRDIVRANRDMIDPQLDWDGQMPSVKLVLDQDRVRALGLDPQTVSQSLQALVTGYTVTTVRDRTEKVGVVARAIASQRGELGSIEDLTIMARNGVPVPVSQVARIERGFEDAILWRRARDLTMIVRADIRDGVQAPDVSKRLWADLAELRAKLPVGYRLELGGSIEESSESQHRPVRDRPGDDRGDAAHPDASAAELLAACAHAVDRAARPHRHDGGAAGVRDAVRVRDAAWAIGPRRHDHPQHRHPGGSDRA